MSLKGELKDRFVNMRIYALDKKRISISTVLLEVIGNGSTMTGVVSWYDSAATNIRSSDTLWSRI